MKPYWYFHYLLEELPKHGELGSFLYRAIVSMVGNIAGVLPEKDIQKLIRFVSICRPQKTALFLARYWLWGIYITSSITAKKTYTT
ncbi:MAG: hypothetical protein ACLR3P_09525 [Hungatella sp.]|uniref:Uncharacterized protein n=1 Tax=Hungatella hathewayi DSM 13479 TaxID=566550 RepID=D3AT85_9FIRM|nr:hypothetical protein [Hungatella sp.]EFC94965.1 hypothetical protein CLOSTHATH_06844 [Hungatella hathewayi DSM 13479]